MNKYRIFISYSRENKDHAWKIKGIIEEINHIPILDLVFASGYGFPDQIRNLISHSYVFLPLISNDAEKSGWVQQEVGYAVAMNIPILPIILNDQDGRKNQNKMENQAQHEELKPSYMLRDLIPLYYDDIIKNQEILKSRIEDLIEYAKSYNTPLFELTEFQEDRTINIVNYSNEMTRLLNLNNTCCVRIIASLSSFHIPKEPTVLAIWTEQFKDNKKTDFLYRWLRKERLIIERHAKKSGCKLILYPGSLEEYEKLNKKSELNGNEILELEAEKSKLGTLLDFIKNMHNEKRNITIAIDERLARGNNLMIVGDWFLAKLHAFWPTSFTRHASYILSQIYDFEAELYTIIRNKYKIECKLEDNGLLYITMDNQTTLLAQVISEVEKIINKIDEIHGKHVIF